MKIGRLTAWGQSEPEAGAQAAAPNLERFLTLLVEGAASNMPEIDASLYESFRTQVGKLALQIPDRLPEEDKLILARSILQEFETYRKGAETELRNRFAGWRTLTACLFRELLKSLGVDAAAPAAAQLLKKLSTLTAAEEISDFCGQLETFLHPAGADSVPKEASKFKAADFSTANNNAAGLRGGGSALEHVKRLKERGDKGFIVFFRLSCLHIINQRFGPEVVEDCLMAVSAFLTQSLHSSDAIYHWSDSSLLAILQGRANEQILTAELDRVVMQNRETTVNIDGRATMLRIPISFDITPIDSLQSADDLHKLTLLANGKRTR